MTKICKKRKVSIAGIQNIKKRKRIRKQHIIMLYSNNGNSPCVALTNETFTVYAEIPLRLKFRSKTQIKNQLQADGN